MLAQSLPSIARSASSPVIIMTHALPLLQSEGVEHPLLATPPPDALVSPSLPVRVFLQTKARPTSPPCRSAGPATEHYRHGGRSIVLLHSHLQHCQCWLR